MRGRRRWRRSTPSGVVPITPDGEIVMIEQYRHAAGGFLWEIPAGVLRPGEEPCAGAQRELAEEVGLEAGTLSLLATMLPTPGYSDERIHLFLGRGLRDVAMAHEEDEVIRRIERVPLEAAVSMVRTGEIPDGKTALALLLAARALEEAA